MITPIPIFQGLNITFNVTEDCNIRCKYCLTAGTKVLLPSLKEKNIEDIKIGEEVLSFEEWAPLPSHHRQIKKSKVIKLFKNKSSVIQIKTEKGLTVNITKNHPILNYRGSSKYSWKEAGKYKVGEVIRVFPKIDYEEPTFDLNYKIGYFIGIMMGDGSHKKYIDKNGYEMYKIRIAMKDIEAINRIESYIKDLGIELYHKNFLISKKLNIMQKALFANTREQYDKICDLIKNNFSINNDLQYLKGFLAGIYDAEGSFDKKSSIIRVCNTNLKIIEEIEKALKLIAVPYIREIDQKGTKNFAVKYNIRILNSPVSYYIKFIKEVEPAIIRKGIQNIYGKSYLQGDRIVSIEEKKEEVEVYNFETESHTYIANNICVHNCYELDKRKNDLPVEYAKKFIDLMLTDPDPIGVTGTENEWMLNNGLIMDFIGGDALMRPKLVQETIEYFMFQSILLNHRWADRWRTSISTNGTLFDEPGVKDFLMKFRKNISLGISIDGCPEVHNLNRDNSMDAILLNWEWYKEYAGKYATTKSTLNKDSIPYLFKSLKFMHEYLGLNYVNQNFIFEPMQETEDDMKELDRQMDKCIDYVLQHKDDLYWSMIDGNFMCGVHMKDPDKGWCGAGAMPALGINGKIYPCFRFLPHTMSSRSLDFHVGDIWNGFDHKERFQEVREQTRAKISPQKCLDCPVESGCAWCIGGAYSETGCFYRTTNICNVHKIQDKWAKIYWAEYNKLVSKVA